MSSFSLWLFLCFIYFYSGNSLVQKCDTVFTTVTLIPLNVTQTNSNFVCEPPSEKDVVKHNILRFSEKSNAALSLTAIYNLFDKNGKTYFSIQNLTVLSYDYHFSGVTGICSIGGNSDDRNCTTLDKNFALTLPVNITKINLNLQLTTPESRDFNYESLMTYLIIDEGSFNMPDGSLFSQSQKNYSMTFIDGFLYTTYINYACTSFKDISEAQINSRTCKTFKSRTTFYNVDDNYSIFATIQTNYSLTDNLILLNSKYNGPSSVFIKISSYDYCICETFEKNCTFPFSTKKDAKILFFLEYDDFQTDLKREILSGRIIIRNGNILMEEGKPFSAQNDCSYFSDTLTNFLVSTSEFCCINFDDA